VHRTIFVAIPSPNLMAVNVFMLEIRGFYALSRGVRSREIDYVALQQSGASTAPGDKVSEGE
jgi:hypothetical protein